MKTDADLVRLCASIYDPSTQWDHYWDGAGPSGICAGIKDNCLIFRGSITLLDWYRDTLARGFVPFKHPELDLVDFGFDEGMDEFTQEAFQFLRDGATFSGHSLGAARAWLAAGRYIIQGDHPERIAVFGSPRPGCQALGQIVAPYSKVSYKNRSDPVTEVPLPLRGFMAIQPTSFTMLNVETTDADHGFLLDFLDENLWFADHHIQLYEKGVNA